MKSKLSKDHTERKRVLVELAWLAAGVFVFYALAATLGVFGALARSLGAEDENSIALIVMFAVILTALTVFLARQWLDARHQIAQRRIAERQLRETEAHLRGMIDNSLQSLTLIDSNYKVLSFNSIADESAKIIFGKGMKVGDSIRDFVKPEDFDRFSQYFDRAMHGQTIVIERNITGENNEDYWFELTFNPVRTLDGPITGVCYTVQNIDERKQAEQALRRAQDSLQARVQEQTAEIARLNESSWLAATERDRAHDTLAQNKIEFERILEQRSTEWQERLDGLQRELDRHKSKLIASEQTERELRQVNAALTINLQDQSEELDKVGDALRAAFSERDRAQAALTLAETEFQGTLAAGIAKAQDSLGAQQHEFERMLTEQSAELNEKLCRAQEAFTRALAEQTSESDERLCRAQEEFARTYEQQTGEFRKKLKELQEALEREQGRAAELFNSQIELRELVAYQQAEHDATRISTAREIQTQVEDKLAALKKELRLIGDRLRKDQAPLLRKTKAVAKVVDHALIVSRRVSSESTPLEVNGETLVGAMQQRAKIFSERTGITYKISSNVTLPNLNPNRSSTLLRILEEVLASIGSAPPSTRVKISLSEAAEQITLEVQVNGNLRQMTQLADHKSLAVFGMQERAWRFGGELQVSRNSDKQIIVTVTMPTDHAED